MSVELSLELSIMFISFSLSHAIRYMKVNFTGDSGELLEVDTSQVCIDVENLPISEK